MLQIFNYLFEQYSEYETLDIILEITGVVFGLLSVWFSKNNNILVFPTGMISTAIFVYLLYLFICDISNYRHIICFYVFVYHILANISG